jgi:glycosyltransferase involved in cell wall biosynthesis
MSEHITQSLPPTSSTILPMLVIVIPTRNRRALLERSLESVLAQSYTHDRIVVVNDGSTDTTQMYLDSLIAQQIQVINRVKTGGVNAARNAALKTLTQGEWAVPLDDDDVFLPGALETIANAIAEIPSTIQILSFNTRVHTPTEIYNGGRDFLTGESYYEPSYFAIMTGEGLRTRGDTRSVWKWTLFPQYLFAEDVNGFEGEWWLLVARDGIGIRYLPQQTTLIDQQHGEEQLSLVAARRNPASFVRAHERIFHAHKKFFTDHPKFARERAVVALKLCVRAGSPFSAIRFSIYYLRSFFTRSSQVPM